MATIATLPSTYRSEFSHFLVAYEQNRVYATEVRAHLQRLENDLETKIVPLGLSGLYLKRAGVVAEQQATRAGW